MESMCCKSNVFFFRKKWFTVLSAYKAIHAVRRKRFVDSADRRADVRRITIAAYYYVIQ